MCLRASPLQWGVANSKSIAKEALQTSGDAQYLIRHRGSNVLNKFIRQIFKKAICLLVYITVTNK